MNEMQDGFEEKERKSTQLRKTLMGRYESTQAKLKEEKGHLEDRVDELQERTKELEAAAGATGAGESLGSEFMAVDSARSTKDELEMLKREHELELSNRKADRAAAVEQKKKLDEQLAESEGRERALGKLSKEQEAQLSGLLAQVEDLAKTAKEQGAKARNLESERREIEGQLKTKAAELEDAQSSCNRLEEQLAKVNLGAEAAFQARETAEGGLTEKMVHLERLQTAAADERKQLEGELEASKQAHIKSEAQLQRKIEQLESARAELKGQLDQSKEAYDVAAASHLKQTRELQDENKTQAAAAQAKQNELESVVELLRKSVSDSEATLADTQRQVVGLEQRAQASSATDSERTDAEAKLRFELGQLKSAHADRSAAADQFTAEALRLTSELASEQQAVQTLEVEVQRLTQREVTLRNSNEGRKTELAVLQDRFNVQKAELAAALHRLEAAGRVAVALATEQAEAERKSAEVTQLQLDMEAAASATRELQRSAKETSGEKERLEARLSQMTTANDRQTEELNALRAGKEMSNVDAMRRQAELEADLLEAQAELHALKDLSAETESGLEMLMEEQEQEMEQTQKELDATKSALAAAIKEAGDVDASRKKLAEECIALKAELATTKADLEKATTTQSDLSGDKQELEQLLESVTTQRDELKVALSTSAGELAGLQQQLIEANKKSAALQEATLELERQLETATNDHIRADDILKQLQQQMDANLEKWQLGTEQNDRAVKAVTGELAEANSKLELATFELSGLEASNRALESELNAAKDDLQIGLAKRDRDLEDEKEERQREGEEYEMMVEDLSNELESLTEQSEISKLEKAKAEAALVAVIAQHAAELEKYRKEKSMDAQSLRKLVEKHESLTSANKLLVEKVARLEKQLAEQATDQTRLMSTQGEQLNEVEQLRAELQSNTLRHTAEVASLQQTNEEHAAALVTLKAELNQITEAKEALDEELETVKEDLETVTRDKDNAIAEIDDLMGLQSEMNTEIDGKAEKIEELESEKEVLKSKISSLESDLAELQSQVEQLEAAPRLDPEEAATLEKLKTENSTLQAEATEHSEEIEELKAKNGKLLDEINELMVLQQELYDENEQLRNVESSSTPRKVKGLAGLSGMGSAEEELRFEELNDEMQKMKRDLNKQQIAEERQKNEFQRAQSTIAEQKAAMEEMEAGNSDLLEELSELQSDMMTMNEELEAAKTNGGRRSSDVGSGGGGKSSGVNLTQIELEEVQEKLEASQTELKQQTELASTKSDELVELREKHAEQGTVLAHTTKDRDALTDEVNDFMVMMTEVNEEIKQLKNDKGISTAVETQKGISGTAGIGEALLREDLEGCKEQIEELKQDLASVTATKADELAKMQSLLDEKQQEFEDVLEEVEDLTAENDETIHMVSQLNDELDECKNTIRMNKALGSTAGGPLNATASLIPESAYTEDSSAAEELDDKRREIRVLEAKLQDTTLDNQDYQLKIQKLTRDLSNANFQITKLQNEVDSLKKKAVIDSNALDVARNSPRRMSSHPAAGKGSDSKPVLSCLGASSPAAVTGGGDAARSRRSSTGRPSSVNSDASPTPRDSINPSDFFNSIIAAGSKRPSAAK
jgi:chromosome segregation ATPase